MPTKNNSFTNQLAFGFTLNFFSINSKDEEADAHDVTLIDSEVRPNQQVTVKQIVRIFLKDCMRALPKTSFPVHRDTVVCKLRHETCRTSLLRWNQCWPYFTASLTSDLLGLFFPQQIKMLRCILNYWSPCVLSTSQQRKTKRTERNIWKTDGQTDRQEDRQTE